MGKKQHSKDLMYITHSEWATQYGGYKDRSREKKRFLPFNYCALTLQPFEDPVCTDDGTTFDLTHIIPYLQKKKRNPVDGSHLSIEDLTRIEYAKNTDGEYICPMTFKVFNEHSHIVAVKTSGKVYSYEAVEQFNIKPKHWLDLLTNQPFTRKDIIHLQDPQQERRKAIGEFEHLRDASLQREKEKESSIVANASTERIFKEMEEKGMKVKRAKTQADAASSSRQREMEVMLKREEEKAKAAEQSLARIRSATASALSTSSSTSSYISPALYAEWDSERDTGKVATSFTSSSFAPSTQHEREKMTEEDFLSSLFDRVRRRKKKAFVSIATSVGNINLQLHTDIVPRTCFNFIQLCLSGYYNKTVFHRIIRGFMVQGGDPTGTGRGGQSWWKKPFRDEFDSRLTHDKRGVLSMANSGKNTNGSQFFITFKPCTHLDLKHAVFGEVVGGTDTLKKLEDVETNTKDRPLSPPSILSCTVYDDPYLSEIELWRKEKEDEAKKKVAAAESSVQRMRKVIEKETTTTVADVMSKKESGSAPAIGRYLNSTSLQTGGVAKQQAAVDGQGKKKRKAAGGFGDFSGW
mmetsp:Transcript_33973/g.87227  ORF Transcript_33973/g.87227 Transcript_33973/m.87227 type:complete len:578 (-) Transcript_33973:195-1928(-)